MVCHRLSSLLLILLSLQLSSCSPPAAKEEQELPTMTAVDNPNQGLLDEVNAAKLWFHAKKTRPIWARQLQQAELVKTLEGDEDVPAGQFVCRGEAGDIWPQSPESLTAKYEATDEVTSDGWRKYSPRPDNEGVLAAQIAHAFAVQAKWGKLTGKPGDMLVKNFDDRDQPYPADVWIVDQALFQATYETVTP